LSNINLSTGPKLVQQQRLILTQELQLFLKMIQMNTIELKEYLEEQLIENPTLEEVPEEDNNKKDDDSEDLDLSELIFSGSTSYSGDDNPHSKDYYSQIEEDNPWENRVSLPASLLDHLRWQLEMLDLPQKDKDIASIIIGNINEDGYLEVSVADIAEIYINQFVMIQGNNCPGNESDVYSSKSRKFLEKNPDIISDVNSVLNILQTSFDPIGVGARSLEECLTVQLRELGYDEYSPVIKMVEQHLEELSEENYEPIIEKLHIDRVEIERLSQIISVLEPKPGRPFYSKAAEKYIVPDFYLYKIGTEYQLQLNKEFPKVRISRYYRNLINKQKQLSNETKKYLKEKIEDAQRMLKCIEEREQAVRKVVENVVRVQRDFFEHGEKYLKPLRLKDIAEIVGVHESTVSRITSNRYIQTPSGVMELKSLFTRGLDTTTGKQVSFERVKSMIREIIENESETNPFSDEDISKILKRKNVNIARRTVAKYRKILKIPSSSKRTKKGD